MQPTMIMFDLDPGPPADLASCLSVSRLLKEKLDGLNLESFAKVSGSKGLQLCVPLNSPVSYEITQAFARGLAELLAEDHADKIVSTMAKVDRKGKVFIDWSQNSAHKTTVGVYSVRAKQETPYVSTPFTWMELEKADKTGKISQLYLEPKDVLKRVAKVGDLFLPLLTIKQKIPKNWMAILNKKAQVKTKVKLPIKDIKKTVPASLKKYAAKRDFQKTREPSPQARQGNESSQPSYVIQKHAASHLHYDFRLQMDGVLKSWAVPKGVPYKKGERRLAMLVEDHPLEYGTFEGTIPKGQYGGGTVMLWDFGRYEMIDGSFGQGKLHFRLRGQKLAGEWILVRSSRDLQPGKEAWFLIKAEADQEQPGEKENKSAQTNRTMEQIAEANDAQWKSHR